MQVQGAPDVVGVNLQSIRPDRFRKFPRAPDSTRAGEEGDDCRRPPQTSG